MVTYKVYINLVEGYNGQTLDTEKTVGRLQKCKTSNDCGARMVTYMLKPSSVNQMNIQSELRK